MLPISCITSAHHIAFFSSRPFAPTLFFASVHIDDRGVITEVTWSTCFKQLPSGSLMAGRDWMYSKLYVCVCVGVGVTHVRACALSYIYEQANMQSWPFFRACVSVWRVALVSCECVSVYL